MDWLREWIWQIVGIIILTAVCDMIVPGGEMKKYVKLVMGLILVVAVIRPIVRVPSVSVAEFRSAENRKNAAELKNRLGEKERFDVIRLYKDKLCRKTEEQLKVKLDISAEVKAEIEVEDDDRFGDITEITVLIEKSSDADAAVYEVQKTVAESVGINTDRVRVVRLVKSGGREKV